MKELDSPEASVYLMNVICNGGDDGYENHRSGDAGEG